MPNGGMHKGEFEELERFFRPIAHCLEEFASDHNLLLERYYHDHPAWSFRFAHPAGGSATIDVVRVSDRSVRVSGTWWLDVYGEFTRYFRDTATVVCPADSAELASLLRSEFAEVLTWKVGAWSRVARGFEDIWGKYSESQFSRMGDNYPHPR